MTRPDRLDSDGALTESGGMLDRGITRAKAAGFDRSNKAMGEVVGYSGESADKHMREFRLGARALTLPKLLQLLDAYPALGRAFVGELAAWVAERGGELRPTSPVTALDNLVTEALALAAVGHEAGRDRAVDADEDTRVTAQADRVRRAHDAYDAAARPLRARRAR